MQCLFNLSKNDLKNGVQSGSVFVDTCRSSWADEMHRFVDSAFGNINSASQPDLLQQDVRVKGLSPSPLLFRPTRVTGPHLCPILSLCLHFFSQMQFNSHYPQGSSSKGSSLKGFSSPGKKRVPNASQSATLPRSTNAKTIEEEPEMVKQYSAPAKTEDNGKVMNHGEAGRSQPLPRSGSWNAHQRRVVEGQEGTEEDRCTVADSWGGGGAGEGQG